MTGIAKIISGGQSGVDRAALDFAIANSTPYGGWCPRGGWAEDYGAPPGLLADYAHLKETPSADAAQRTERNVADGDATLIIVDGDAYAASKGTRLTKDIADKLNKPVIVVDADDEEVPLRLALWLERLGDGVVLNVAGPRESESPGIYGKTLRLLASALSEDGGDPASSLA